VKGEVSFSSTRQDEVGFLARRLEEMSFVFKRRVEQALSDKEEVRAVLSSMSEGVLVIGADRRILHASRAAGKMLDLRAHEPIGRHFWEVLRHNETVALVDAALRSQELLTREISLTVGRFINLL
jgi:two-component system phosphate regulon sensor histidine kinase PhoR